MREPIVMPLSYWRFLFSEERGREVSDAEALEIIREHNAREPESPAGGTYGDIERSEVAPRWWRP